MLFDHEIGQKTDITMIHGEVSNDTCSKDKKARPSSGNDVFVATIRYFIFAASALTYFFYYVHSAPTSPLRPTITSLVGLA